MRKYQTIQTGRVLHLNDCYSALSFLANVCDSQGIFRSKLKTLQLGSLSRSTIFFFSFLLLGLLYFNLPVKLWVNLETRILDDPSKGRNQYFSMEFYFFTSKVHWPCEIWIKSWIDICTNCCEGCWFMHNTANSPQITCKPLRVHVIFPFTLCYKSRWHVLPNPIILYKPHNILRQLCGV